MAGLAAAAVGLASLAVIVVALAFALYQLALPWAGAAGAAAVVAAVAAALLGSAALAIGLVARPKRRPAPARAEDWAGRALAFVREKPVLAISAAVAAGFLAVRNPRYLGEALRSFVDPGPKQRR
ncbi:MAG TPA: hypothetical protein VGS12_06195 [Caulobacteraceae bacterium]|nr:hypothetical protein [Caulobacteraceae bacterium]